jgi:hypothetical protein
MFARYSRSLGNYLVPYDRRDGEECDRGIRAAKCIADALQVNRTLRWLDLFGN